MELSCIFPQLIQTITLHGGIQSNTYEFGHDSAYEQGEKHPHFTQETFSKTKRTTNPTSVINQLPENTSPLSNIIRMKYKTKC